MILIIQPLASDEQNLMYPYFVDLSTGKILNQEFWKDSVQAFVGFATENNPHVLVQRREHISESSRISKFHRPVFLSPQGLYTVTTTCSYSFKKNIA